MGKRKNEPKSDEFVVDSDASEEEKPVKKKAKKESESSKKSKEIMEKSSKKKVDSEQEEESETEPQGSSKDVKVKKNKDGKPYVELGKLRRVTASSFRGKESIDIREYYEKDGDVLPGRKGISLSQEQWAKLKELIPVIDGMLGK
ncbi:PC4-domain-containing protein [Atractiella rhizophila]|nr:PC4-domain-containing protein [Atractiella rhizophila]